MTLTAGGWIFLVVAWLLIAGTSVWCLYQVLYGVEKRKAKKG